MARQTSINNALPRTVIALGFVSLFMDISSEMIHSLLPVFLVTSLGASVASVGLIEGVAEATAAISKVFSGTISDWIGKRRPLVLLGYGLAALTKPLFPPRNHHPWTLVKNWLRRWLCGGRSGIEAPPSVAPRAPCRTRRTSPAAIRSRRRATR
jgi:hypothetical protein